MTAVAAPFGLRPVFHLTGGTIRPQAGVIASLYNANIFLGSPVAQTDGSLTLAAAAARAMGSFQGVEFTPPDGQRRYSGMWPANQSATQIVAYLTQDPYIVYEVQANGPIAQDDVGEAGDWTTNDTNAGNTTTQLSTVALGAVSSAAAGLQVLGISRYPDNLAGDAFTIVQARIMEHQLIADSGAL